MALGLALLVAFAVGVALGQALHDNPRPGYELGEQILAELGSLWPDSGCCSAE